VDHESTQQWLRLLHGVGRASRFVGLTMPIDIVHGKRTFAAVLESVAEYATLFPIVFGPGKEPLRRR
jgi:hypothetical protein